MAKILGIDEAGRGAVLGPLVICGALIDEQDLPKLRALKVRDSKLLTPKRREELQGIIKETLADHKLIKVKSIEIDAVRMSGTANLNDLEAAKMAELINHFKPSHAYLDCVDSNPLTFRARLNKHLRVDTTLTLEHKADENYPIVSAASILAKVTRDSEVKSLEAKYGAVGSGYPADPTTQKFLSNWLKQNENYPDIVRKTWGTVTGTIGKKKQKSLEDFK
ncbi:MAG: ribonuclease HII [archaeon]